MIVRTQEHAGHKKFSKLITNMRMVLMNSQATPLIISMSIT